MFIKNKICCFSDLHIGIHQDSPIWHETCINFIKNLKADLLKRDIKDIVICGDINNNRNEISVQTIHIVNKVFNLLKEFNIVLLIGNHDAYYKDRCDINSLGLLSGWNNIKVIDQITTIKQFNKTITFCPWACNINDIVRSNIVFGHFDIMGFKLTNFKVCDNGTNSQDLINKGDLIISGHFHLYEHRNYEYGTIVYLGSPFELNWGEAGDKKGYSILDLQTSQMEFCENTSSPKHKHVRLSELIANGTITDDIKQLFHGNFINFVIDKPIDSNKLDDLVNRLNFLKPLNIKIDFELEDKTLIDDTNIQLTGIDITTSLEEFINKLNIENKQEVLNFTLDLYKKFSE